VLKKYQDGIDADKNKLRLD
jgi:hypothetical protein